MEIVFKQHSDADIIGSFVWIPILENDSVETAVPSLMSIVDHRIGHFYDCNQLVGKEVAGSVGWKGQVAWDIYLFYKPSVRWDNGLPTPHAWVHQLKDEWATKARYRTGEGLRSALLKATEKMLNSG